MRVASIKRFSTIVNDSSSTNTKGVWVSQQGVRFTLLLLTRSNTRCELVGLVAALILLIFSPDVTNFFHGAYRGKLDLLVRALLTLFLMVASGWLGGVLGSHGRKKS